MNRILYDFNRKPFQKKEGSRAALFEEEKMFLFPLPGSTDVNEWHASLYDPTMADAICDRIVHNAHIIRAEGDSMHKRGAIAE